VTEKRRCGPAAPAAVHVTGVVRTGFEEEESVFLALRAGARGYLLEDAEEDELLGAVRAVARGEAIVSQAVAGRVLAFFAQPCPAPRAFPELTDRERRSSA
jgi:DNA-binding NarL/FixJ family response regulator